MEQLYDYLFHYNPYQKQWHAFNREDYNKYFNGDRNITVIKGEDIDDVITEILVRTKKKK